jgi:hypothetical protein
MGCSGSKNPSSDVVSRPTEIPTEELNMNEVKNKLNDLYLAKESYNQVLRIPWFG